MGKAEQQFEHLTDAQIEHYGDRTSGEGPNQKGLEIDQAIETHLADCAGCRIRVLEFHRSRFGLMNDPSSSAPGYSGSRSQGDPDSGGSQKTGVSSLSPTNLDLFYLGRSDEHRPTPACPTADSLRDLAAGLSSSTDAPRLTQHAAQCPHCGPILRAYTEDFSDDLNPEDQALLSQLKSSTPEWQKRMAQQMAGSVSLSAKSATRRSPAAAEQSASENTRVAQPPSAVRFRLPSLKWVLAPVALAATVVIAFFIWNAQRETPEKVEKLLAQAYTEQRTMEMRWPGADYAPMRVTRGPEESRFAKPAPLLEAEGIISRNEGKSEKDVGWLQAKASAEILERQPAAAIAELNTALEAHPDSGSVMTDLGVAYALNAEISDDPRNLEQAIEFFSKALKKEPNNREALFNRAVLFERMKFVENAIADWEALLKNEKDPGWKAEAEKRLASLKELKRNHARFVLPQTIQEWTAALTSNDPVAAENALEPAVVDWLPKYAADPMGLIANLLHLTAEKLKSEHNDPWLSDLLRTRASPNFAAGISALQKAVLLNSQGKATDAILPARAAESYFLRDYNLAGLARAQLEEIYAYQRSGAGSACLQRAGALRTNIHGRKYPWLNYQLLLDEASCFNILGRLEEAKLDADDVLAQDDGAAAFKVLRLRALGIAAALATTRGDSASAIKKDMSGLQEYWAGEYPIIRAYQFYSDLSFNTEAAEVWHLTYAANKEAAGAIAQTPNKQVEAVARYRLAKAAVMVGQEQIERDEIRKADGIFAGLSQNESTLIAQSDGVVGVVRAYLNLGKTDAASDRLKQLKLSPAAMESRLVYRRLQQLRGDIEFKLGHFKEAQEPYLAAVAIAESSLSTLPDDRDRLRWSQENGPSYRALANALIRQGDPVAALEVWELYRAAPIRGANPIAEQVAQQNGDAHLALAAFKNSGIVHKIQRRLRNETLIIYAFLPDGLGIWSLEDSGIDFQFAQLSAREIERLAQQFTEECSTPQSDLIGLRKDGSDLYHALIDAAGSHLIPDRTLVFETDGELDNLPFAALVDGSGKYLMEKYPMMFSPGLSYRDYLRQPEPIRRTDRALIVGDPAISAKWRRLLPALPSARAEAEAVAGKFENPVVLLGTKASLSEVERALPSAQVFQFAGHAIQSDTGPPLLFARDEHGLADGFGSSSDIPKDELRSLQVAILSACSTGMTRSSARPSLVTPFLLAKIPNIVVTRWDVDSGRSLVFISALYDKLLAGETVPQSLQAAAQSVVTHSDLSHPYYWAPFFDIGNE